MHTSVSSSTHRLSTGQRLLWFLDRHRGDAGALNCPMLCRLRGSLDTSALRAAIDDLCLRHESLRTTFIGRGRDIRQVIHQTGEMKLVEIDVSHNVDPNGAFNAALATELRTRIDPTQRLSRITLYRLAEQEFVLCMNLHHLVTDAWSCGILLRDLCALYEQRLGMQCLLPAVTGQYSTFCRWQETYFRGDAVKPHTRYWMRQLEHAMVPALPQSSMAQETMTTPEPRCVASIDPLVDSSLRCLARSLKTTVFNLLLSAYYLLLHQVTGQTDLTVACLFANRQEPDFQQTIGFLANMLLLRTRLGKSTRLADILSQTHNTVIDAIVHQSVPYYLLPLKGIAAPTGRADDIVFQVMAQPLGVSRAADIEVEPMVPPMTGNRFELELVVIPHHEAGFSVILFYNPMRFDRAWAQEFTAGYVTATRAIATSPNAALAS